MAKIEIVTLTDSLDERIKTGVETRTFFNPLTGQKLEIELGEANFKHFQNHLDKLSKYIDASREVEVPVTAKPAAKADGRNAEIRKWAQENGFKIGDRGRIKAEIVEAYDKAHADTKAEAPVVEEIAVTVVTEPVDSSTEDAVESPEEIEPTDAELEAETERAELTDEHILAMMSELEAENGGKVELDDLLDKAAEVK